MLLLETQFWEKTFEFVTVHTVPGFPELFNNLLSWRGKIGDSYSCFKESKPLDLEIKLGTTERTKGKSFWPWKAVQLAKRQL